MPHKHIILKALYVILEEKKNFFISSVQQPVYYAMNKYLMYIDMRYTL